MKYCYSAGLKPEYHLSQLRITHTLSMRIPLAETARSKPLCQGVGAVLPRGIIIGCVSVLGLRFVLAIFRRAKSPRSSRYASAYSLKTLGIVANERQVILSINVVSLLPRNEYLRAFALFCKLMTYLHWIKNKITNFAASEGRNPRVKNAFLALSYTIKSPNFTRRDEEIDALILFCICTRTASRCS